MIGRYRSKFKQFDDNGNLLCYFDSGRVPTNLSVDRIDSGLGYIKGNIQLVCMAANQMKSDLTIEQLKYFCKSILEYQK